MLLLGTSVYRKETQVKRRGRKLRIYIVVEVWRGIAAAARSFANLRDAQDYLKRLSRKRNLVEGDVQLFENSIQIRV